MSERREPKLTSGTKVGQRNPAHRPAPVQRIVRTIHCDTRILAKQNKNQFSHSLSGQASEGRALPKAVFLR
jgi:hypothetical protein